MISRVISKEIGPSTYLVRRDKEKIIYAPFKGVAVSGWRTGLAKWILPLLPNAKVPPQKASLPITVSIDITHRCPLRCAYCAVEGGKDASTIDPKIAKAAVDKLVENAQIESSESIVLLFGCGGEATSAWTILVDVINYAEKAAEKNGINLITYIATSGILSESQIEWLTEHASHIVLSFDGPPAAQNHHRPLASGEISSPLVEKTARFLAERSVSYSIRATISEVNSDLSELIVYFSEFKPSLVYMQPIMERGRCCTTGWKTMNADVFIWEYRRAKRIAAEKGISLLFPGTRIDRIITKSCDAYTGSGYVLTSTGLITACEKVVSQDDPNADLFIYGRYEEGELKLDQRKLKNLQEIGADTSADCADCFCKWHCSRGCLVDHLHKREPVPTEENVLCYITRELAWDVVTDRLKQAENGGGSDTPLNKTEELLLGVYY